MKTTYRVWIGKRLKYFRGLMNWTQQYTAEQISMQKRSYGKYEDGEAEPSIYTLKKLCTLFNITLDEFMKDSPQEPIQLG